MRCAMIFWVTTAAGYSGTPLARKLGIKAGHRVALMHAAKPLKFVYRLADRPSRT